MKKNKFLALTMLCSTFCGMPAKAQEIKDSASPKNSGKSSLLENGNKKDVKVTEDSKFWKYLLEFLLPVGGGEGIHELLSYIGGHKGQFYSRFAPYSFVGLSRGKRFLDIHDKVIKYIRCTLLGPLTKLFTENGIPEKLELENLGHIKDIILSDKIESLINQPISPQPMPPQPMPPQLMPPQPMPPQLMPPQPVHIIPLDLVLVICNSPGFKDSEIFAGFSEFTNELKASIKFVVARYGNNIEIAYTTNYLSDQKSIVITWQDYCANFERGCLVDGLLGDAL